MFKRTALTVAIAGTALLAPATTNAAELETPMKKNMWDDDVHIVQQDLKELGFFDYKQSTGYFGDITEEGVKGFQKEIGLEPTGIVDKETAMVLEEATELMKKGEHGKAVVLLQKHLAHMNLYEDDVDGIFGPHTKQAVVDYQKEKDLQVDGIVGPETKKSLFEGVKTATSNKTSNSADKPSPTVKKESADEAQKTMTMDSTAYTANCDGCSGTTTTGIDLNKNPDQKVIAVDPDVIPLGTEVYVEGYGRAVAGDTGGKINGNKIDVYFQSEDQAMNWGTKEVKVTILD